MNLEQLKDALEKYCIKNNIVFGSSNNPQAAVESIKLDWQQNALQGIKTLLLEMFKLGFHLPNNYNPNASTNPFGAYIMPEMTGILLGKANPHLYSMDSFGIAVAHVIFHESKTNHSLLSKLLGIFNKKNVIIL